MSGPLLVVTVLGLVAAGRIQANHLPYTSSFSPESLGDSIGTASEAPLAATTRTDSSTKTEEDICKEEEVPSLPILGTGTKSGVPEDGEKIAVTVQKIEKLPDDKMKEVVVTAEKEKLPFNATVTKTVERQVVKSADGEATGNETITEKETRTYTSPFNATVTQTTTEHKVVKGEEGEEEIEEKEEIVTEKEVVKAEKIEKEVEPGEKPEPEMLPVNSTVKETSVVKNTSQDGKVQEVVVEKTTRIYTTNVTETPTGEKVGPPKATVTEKTEKFPDNETKAVVVQEEPEKLSSNGTIKTTVVEQKITKDTAKDRERPQQETLSEKVVEEKITNKTANLIAEWKRREEGYKREIKDLRRQLQKVKQELIKQQMKEIKEYVTAGGEEKREGEEGQGGGGEGEGGGSLEEV